jgi:hypothetical protein
MPSERQLVANKKNAQKSTGPKTPEGRAAVRLNGVKHGLTAATLVLPGESESDFESLLDSFESEHNPATPTEEALVRQMAMAQWRLLRCYHIESAFFTLRMDDLQMNVRDAKKLDRFAPLAVVARCDCDSANLLPKLSAMQARLERSFYKALHELERLRAARPQKMENQTQSHDQTPPPNPVPSPITTEDPMVGQAGSLPTTKSEIQHQTPPKSTPFLLARPAKPDPAPETI